jgi:hypothetical protein
MRFSGLGWGFDGEVKVKFFTEDSFSFACRPTTEFEL